MQKARECGKGRIHSRSMYALYLINKKNKTVRKNSTDETPPETKMKIILMKSTDKTPPDIVNFLIETDNV